jgi:hypothetical protein
MMMFALIKWWARLIGYGMRAKGIAGRIGGLLNRKKKRCMGNV